jgi:hypothetical protein
MSKTSDVLWLIQGRLTKPEHDCQASFAQAISPQTGKTYKPGVALFPLCSAQALRSQ